jgi:hypothetical protein
MMNDLGRAGARPPGTFGAANSCNETGFSRARLYNTFKLGATGGAVLPHQAVPNGVLSVV